MRFRQTFALILYGAAIVGCSNVLDYGALEFEAGSVTAGDAGDGGEDATALDAGGSSEGGAGAPGQDASGGAAGDGGSTAAGGEAGAGGADGGTEPDGGADASGSAGSAGTGGTAGAAGSDGGSVYPPPLDLGAVTWLHTNVSGWPVTVNLASVTFEGSLICLNHDIAQRNWPIKNISGTDVVANPWVFIYRDDRWYGATWEWLRPPGQTCKNQSSVAGDHIKVAPFDAASGWHPQSGETFYFMVSGLARLGLSNVQERSEPVKVVWP